MTVTLYSFVMAVLWFSAFILLGTLVQHLTGVILCCRPVSLLCLAALTVARLVLPLDLPITQVLTSTIIYPAIQDALYAPLFGPDTVPCYAVLLLVWGAGSLVTGGLLVRCIRRDRRTVGALPTAPAPAARQCLDDLLKRRGLRRRVDLLVSPALTSPLLTGLLRPVILLSPQAAALPRRELEYILTHELTHLTNGDLWVKLLVRLLGCLMWWNPCVYLLQRDLDSTLEYNCDLAVTWDLPQGEQQAYLQSVLTVLRQLRHTTAAASPKPVLQAGFLGIPEGEQLKRRFQLVLDQRKAPRRGFQAAFVTVALALFLFSYSVVLQPAHTPPPFAGEVIVTPENSYIFARADGTYSLVYEGAPAIAVTPETLDDVPHCYLNIVYEEGN